MAFSDHVALLVERASLSIVAVHGGRWSSSGIHWRPGVIVTAEEVLERDDELTVTLSRPSTAPAPIGEFEIVEKAATPLQQARILAS
jgi:hypothetical protein